MIRSFSRPAAICTLALSAFVCATEVTVLDNATLIDGTGRAPVASSMIVITDGRITYAGPKAEGKVPAGATRVNLTGKYFVPGVINLHGHLGATKGLIQYNVNYTRENTFQQLKTYANYRITTVVSMASHQPRLSRQLSCRLGAHHKLSIAR